MSTNTESATGSTTGGMSGTIGTMGASTNSNPSDDDNASVTPSATGNSTNTTQGRNQRQLNSSGGNNFANSETKDWYGMEPAIGGVLGMRVEKLSKKVSFDIFREKLEI